MRRARQGPYHWMTYAEVSKGRTEIGSGLLHYGMKSGFHSWAVLD